MMSEPWYKDGLRFACTQCGNCCTGAPGYVWMNEEEVQAMANYINMPVEDFRKVYTRKAGIRTTLREKSNYDCVFFDSVKRNCTVYPVRPRQCRTWPFWDSNLRSPEAWEGLKETCPGVGKGNFVSLEEIQRQAAVLKL